MVTFTLTTGVMGLGELQSETSDRDPRSSFMTELAWLTWGVPSLPTCVSFVYPERFDRLGGSVGLPAEILFFGLLRPGLGRREAARVWWRFGSCAHRVVVVDRAVVVGHGQATSRLIRSRSIEQGASHRFRARLICIKWERERNSRPAFLPSPIGASLLNRYPFPFSRSRERVFTLFF